MFFEDNNFKNYDLDVDIIEFPGFNFSKMNLENTTYYEPQAMNKQDNYMQSSKFVSAKDGLMRGNLFAGEYEPYNNFTFFKLEPKTEREMLLFKVYEYDFAINDLNLYLDLHSEDMYAFELLKKYTKECKQAKKEYSKIFGPLNLFDTKDNSYKWSEDPWPWMNDGGSKYV